jgi:hypothetical protein
MVRVLVLVCSLLLGPGGASAAEPGAMLTILDGGATLLVGARALVAAEGVRLPEGTIIDTNPSTGLLRVEWNDGRVLDLGPATRVMVAPVGLGGASRPAFYLLQGWAKYSSTAAPKAGWLSPALDLAPLRGVTVTQIDAAETRLFVESGSVQLVERASATRRTMATGEYLAVTAGGAGGQVAPRPSAALLQKLPASFRDTIAPRAAAFKGREVEARPALAPSYAELQPWLNAEPALRRDFPRRFAARWNEPDFRNALTANMRQHPEWQAWLQSVQAASGASK